MDLWYVLTIIPSGDNPNQQTMKYIQCAIFLAPTINSISLINCLQPKKNEFIFVDEKIISIISGEKLDG